MLESRRLRPEDLQQCCDLFVRSFNDPPWRDRWTLESAHRFLQPMHNAAGFLGLAVTDAETILGFAVGSVEEWYDGKHYYLREICVAPDRRREGIGTRLMEALHRDLGTMGVTHVYLLTARDTPAEEFYRQCGYALHRRMIMLTRRLR